ncbi:MAG: VCBS repeat-containing protein [Planctomycetota bacterium]|nr:MAG: VCBS repeat-containing protein [Planctomycetota bacterium]
MLVLPSLLLALAPQGGPNVPLRLHTDPNFPSGLNFGDATGVSFGDFDADGWTDVFVFSGGALWRNEKGTTFSFAWDANTILTQPASRYGASFGDYNNDGLPDIATEPREGYADSCFHLLRSLPAVPSFLDVAGFPGILDQQPCNADSETISWADVDGDGDLDLFLPIYPPAVGSIDNKFLHNLGPTGPYGEYRFSEQAAAAGLLVPAGNARPEGSWFFDSDRDGDLDLYANGGLYRNISAFDAPLFESLPPGSSGIRKRTIVDEGVFFTDFDRDGDDDLLISYTGVQGIRIWEARGDGSYQDTPTTLIENYQAGAGFGLSAADWDLDGDVDFQAQDTYRRNMLVETGVAEFKLQSHTIDPNHTSSATVAWGDWDHDGDPDAVLGNGARGGWLYDNTTYDAATPPEARRHLRVRVVRDAPGVPRGLETEYGAAVEVRVLGEENGPRRRQLLSSAAGYLTQNEYALTFALPPDPDPADPRHDVRFDLVVDFPGLPDQGWRRVDKFVNPALGGIDLAALGADREITVSRSGFVRLHGAVLPPAPTAAPALVTTGGGLAVPTAAAALPDPLPAADPWWFGGVEIDTTTATGPLAVRELIVDGVLGDPVPTPLGPANLLVWDVTVPGSPVLVEHGALARATGANNRRVHLPVDIPLAAGRRYRIVARLAEHRASPLSGPLAQGAFTTTGGLLFHDPNPATGAGVEAAALDPGRVWLAARIDPAPVRDWVDLGNAVAGAGGAPRLRLSGGGRPGDLVTLELSNAAANAEVKIVIGSSVRCAPAAGGFLVPQRQRVVGHRRTGAGGRLVLQGRWPAGHPRGVPLLVQAVVADPTAPQGVAASNAVARLGE